MSTHAIMDASRSVSRNAIYAFSAIMVQLWRYQQLGVLHLRVGFHSNSVIGSLGATHVQPLCWPYVKGVLNVLNVLNVFECV